MILNKELTANQRPALSQSEARGGLNIKFTANQRRQVGDRRGCCLTISTQTE